MKVSLITILDNTKFGTYLQALALSKTIEKLGLDVEIVDYIRPRMSRIGSMSWTRNPWKKLLKWLNYPAIEKLRDADHDFLKRFVALSPVTYSNYKQLKNNPPVADIYVTGSDQVWNSIYNQGIDKAFYLDFADKKAKRVSYAASIGMEDFPATEVKETMQLLSKYTQITVREQKAKNILARLGFANVEVVLDPTLLLDANDWRKISQLAGKPLDLNEPYLLVYSVETKKENTLISFYAKEIASKYHWKIYQVSYGDDKSRIDGVDKLFAHATPDIFLQLVCQSEFMVVSSFHGTAFAINFNKQFLSITPKRFNSRIKSLCSICGLKERILTDASAKPDNLENIDYNRVNAVIQQLRNHSVNILRNMLYS